MRRIRRVAEWTPLIVVGILVVCGLIDYALYRTGGNEATISYTLLTARVQNPAVAHLTAYMFGVFIGHVYYPSAAKVAPKEYIVLMWAVVTLSPVFAVCIGVAMGERAKPMEAITDPWNQIKFGLVDIASFIAGQLVGRFILKQHPFAEVPVP